MGGETERSAHRTSSCIYPSSPTACLSCITFELFNQSYKPSSRQTQMREWLTHGEDWFSLSWPLAAAGYNTRTAWAGELVVFTCCNLMGLHLRVCEEFKYTCPYRLSTGFTVGFHMVTFWPKGQRKHISAKILLLSANKSGKVLIVKESLTFFERVYFLWKPLKV